MQSSNVSQGLLLSVQKREGNGTGLVYGNDALNGKGSIVGFVFLDWVPNDFWFLLSLERFKTDRGSFFMMAL